MDSRFRGNDGNSSLVEINVFTGVMRQPHEKPGYNIISGASINCVGYLSPRKKRGIPR